MIALRDLPTLNAVLNGTSALLLLAGYVLIRRRKVAWHRAFMITAFLVSVVFLVSYVIYHYHAGPTRFTGTGAVRPIYFTLLSTHTVLAAAVPVLATITLANALTARYDRHRKIARVTLPVWFYVSVTGVIIYLFLYHFFPAPRA